MFVRLFKKEGQHGLKEVLFNLNFCTKIEVEYYKDSQGNGYLIDYDRAKDDPECYRVYVLHFGAETVMISSEEDGPIHDRIEELYKKSIRQ